MAHPRVHHSACVQQGSNDGFIYVTGADSSIYAESSKTAVRYSPKNDSWETLPDMGVSWRHHESIFLGSKIFVFHDFRSFMQFLDTKNIEAGWGRIDDLNP